MYVRFTYKNILLMNQELIINSMSNQVLIGLMNDKRLVELHKEKNDTQFSVGDIYFGKVRKVLGGLNAAFVDIGYEKDAFLHYLDLGLQAESVMKYVNQTIEGKQTVSNLMYFKNEADIPKNGKISDLIKSGQNILVQVSKEPISSKGPRVTTDISFAGRYIVLIPFTNSISVSSKIKSNEEKTRLKKLLQTIKPNNFGVIIRTVAEGKSEEDIKADVADLVSKWDLCFKNLKTATPQTKVLGEMDRTNAMLRDFLNASFNAIHVNSNKVYEDLKSYIKTILPDKIDIIKHYTSKIPIFEHFGVDRQIKSLFGKTVFMKSGAYLVVEHTEALHVIDVNSGNRAKSDKTQEENALEVNIEAAVEVARQLRLRDMGGIIVVDFIDLHSNDNRNALFTKLKEEMKSDRAKHNILPPSKFGLIQITRQRLRPEVNIEVLETCPSCNGTGKTQPSILFVDQITNALRFLIKEKNASNITLTVHPYIMSHMQSKGFLRSIQWKYFFQFKKWIKITSSVNYGFMEYHFFDKELEEITI